MKILRPIALPILVVLYIGAIIPLAARNACHQITKGMDWAFDFVARCASWDPTYWPLPKASDNPLEEV